MKIALVWNMTPCSLTDVDQRPVTNLYYVVSKCRMTFSKVMDWPARRNKLLWPDLMFKHSPAYAI